MISAALKTFAAVADQPLRRAQKSSAVPSLNSVPNRLMLADVAAVALANVLAKLLYVDWYLGQTQEILPYLLLVVPLSLALLSHYRHLHLLEIDTLLEPLVGFGKVWGGLALSFLMLLGMLYLLKLAEFYSRGWFLCWFALSAVLVLSVHWLTMRKVRTLFEQGRFRRPVALYGDPEYVEQIRLRMEQKCAYTQVDGIYLAASQSHDSAKHAIDGLSALREAMARSKYDKIIVGFPQSQITEIRRAVGALASFSSEVLLCTDLNAPLELHGPRPVEGLRAEVVNRIPASVSDWVLKRVFDNTIALLGLIALLPVFGLIAVAIKIESRGPVFFRQRRYGQNNRIFRIYKFRTMTVTEDDENARQAEQNDRRVTRVGAFLRATSIDELPQFINVLLGEMSLVGPRPHAIAHDDRFELEVDLFASRRQVLPGLTGWAQVNGFRGETKNSDDIRHRVEHDLYYIRTWSIWLDMEIIARTVTTVLRGAY
ncbi:MAG: exopolysaccharide biosynthesis polyprenyl glycosylphosphotransferase [Hyphomicrobium sp.]